MPSKHTITAVWFDTCYSAYLQDRTRMVVGIKRTGQTREELIEEVGNTAYAYEDFPLGDYVFGLLNAAVTAAVPADFKRLWPVDAMGKEITDEDAKAPKKQPSAWFRITVKSEPLRIRLSQSDDDDGSVLVTCDDREAAADDGYIDGSTWETPSDMSDAYSILTDRPTLVEKLTADGYDVDASEYSPPDQQDLDYWQAKCERSNNASPAELRELLRWVTLDDVRANRRVQDRLRSGRIIEEETFVKACFQKGWVL